MNKGITYFILFLSAFTATIGAHAASVHWESVGPMAPGWPRYRGVRFGGNTFVAWGEKALAYTRDGIDWRRAENFQPAEGFTSVAYGNGRFVAVGRSGHISVSRDGAGWNTQ